MISVKGGKKIQTTIWCKLGTELGDCPGGKYTFCCETVSGKMIRFPRPNEISQPQNWQGFLVSKRPGKLTFPLFLFLSLWLPDMACSRVNHSNGMRGNVCQSTIRMIVHINGTNPQNPARMGTNGQNLIGTTNVSKRFSSPAHAKPEIILEFPYPTQPLSRTAEGFLLSSTLACLGEILGAEIGVWMKVF